MGAALSFFQPVRPLGPLVFKVHGLRTFALSQAINYLCMCDLNKKALAKNCFFSRPTNHTCVPTLGRRTQLPRYQHPFKVWLGYLIPLSLE